MYYNCSMGRKAIDKPKDVQTFRLSEQTSKRLAYIGKKLRKSKKEQTTKTTDLERTIDFAFETLQTGPKLL
jgi:hypothetical protein